MSTETVHRSLVPMQFINKDSLTTDVQGLDAAANLRLMGFIVAETAGTPAAAEVVLRHGTTDAATIIARIKLKAGDTVPFSSEKGMPVASGVFIERVSGTTAVTLFYDAY